MSASMKKKIINLCTCTMLQQYKKFCKYTIAVNYNVIINIY